MLAMFPVPKKAVIRRNIFINVKDQPQTRLINANNSCKEDYTMRIVTRVVSCFL